MKAFLWQSVEHVTDSYHDDGAVLVIAERLDQAVALLMAEVENREPWHRDVAPEPGIPDRIWDIAADQAEVLIFPNAGCC